MKVRTFLRHLTIEAWRPLRASFLNLRGQLALWLGRKEPEPDPFEALTKAAARLEGKNLQRLWRMCATFSLHDVRAKPQDELTAFPTLNLAKVRSLVQAVLASTCTTDDQGVLVMDDIPPLLNDCVEMQSEPLLRRRLRWAVTKAEREAEVARHVAALGNFQFEEQDPRIQQRMGRAIAMLQTLPTEENLDFGDRERNAMRDLADRIVVHLGCTVQDLGRVFMVVFGMYYASHTHLVQGYLRQALPAQLPDDANERALSVVAALSFVSNRFANRLEFWRAELLRLFGRVGVTGPAIDSFFNLFSCSTLRLRELPALAPALQGGHPGHSVTALDRYPVVSLPEDAGGRRRHIVPNLRIYAKSFLPVLDFSFLESIENYDTVRGYLQELYLRRLISHRLPHLTVIPERPYGKPERRGPDLTLVEPGTGRLLVLESKGKRILAVTRGAMDLDKITDNLEPAIRALAALPSKVTDLYSGLQEYSDAQASLDATQGHEPICVAVLADSVVMMSELAIAQARAEPEHPLHSFPWPYCVMGLDTFEEAVEHAAAGGTPLSEVLLEFWEASSAWDPSTPMADSFSRYRVEYDPQKAFARRFLPVDDG